METKLVAEAQEKMEDDRCPACSELSQGVVPGNDVSSFST